MPKCHTNFKDGIEVVGPTTFQGYDGLGLSSVIAKKIFIFIILSYDGLTHFTLKFIY